MMPECWLTLVYYIFCSGHAVSPFGQSMCIYGDPADPLRLHLEAPFRNAVLTPDMQAFNASMSAERVSVEWLFGDIVIFFQIY